MSNLTVLQQTIEAMIEETSLAFYHAEGQAGGMAIYYKADPCDYYLQKKEYWEAESSRLFSELKVLKAQLALLTSK